MNIQQSILGAVVICLTAAVLAAPTVSADSGQAMQQLEQQNQELRAELQLMRSRLDRVEAQRGQTWLNERRIEEVKTLIAEVLSDADTRMSLLGDGGNAGHDGKNFYLKSADGSFLMKIAGHMQMRMIANWADDPFVDNDTAAVAPSPGDSGSEAEAGVSDGIDDESLDEGASGFTLRRTKLKFYGHVTANPKIGYKIVLAGEREGGAILLDTFEIDHEFVNGVTITAGQLNLPFLRAELVSSSKQLAVDRGSATEYFTLDGAQGIALSWGNDTVKLAGMVSDGADSEDLDWAADMTDIALSGRADVKLVGEWEQADDFSAWSGAGPAAFLGAAVHWEKAETGTTAPNDAVLLWTVDGLVECSGVGIMAAVMGLSTDNETGPDFDDLGFQLEAGVFVVPDKLQPFVRYDYIDVDGMDEMNLLTVGVNYYLNKHNAKFTVDVVHAFDTMFDTSRNFNDPASSGLGLRDDVDGQDGQTALRAQFQVKF
jgi:phosphate-selective porin OprO/OprP